MVCPNESLWGVKSSARMIGTNLSVAEREDWINAPINRTNSGGFTNSDSRTETKATNFTNSDSHTETKATNSTNSDSHTETKATNSPVPKVDRSSVAAVEVAESLEAEGVIREGEESINGVNGGIGIYATETKATNFTNPDSHTETKATNFTNSPDIVTNYDGDLNEEIEVGDDASREAALELLARDPRAVKQAKERLEAFLVNNSMTLKGFAETFGYPVAELSRFRSMDKEEGRRSANSNIVKRLIQQFLMPSFEEWKESSKTQ